MAATLFACYMNFLFLFFFDGIVLQSIVSFFTGADLYRIVNGGDKDLAIAILAGVESLLRYLDDGAGEILDTTMSMRTFGRSFAETAAPRYICVCPFSRP